MKKTLFLSLLTVIVVFSSACKDTGGRFDIPVGDVRVAVKVEREIEFEHNSWFDVYAFDFSLKPDDGGSYILTFTCPCYFGPIGWKTSIVEIVNQEVVAVKLLPGARYNVYERHLDKYERKSYSFLVETE